MIYDPTWTGPSGEQGKLTFPGLIDPCGLTLTPTPSNPVVTGPPQYTTLWVNTIGDLYYGNNPLVAASGAIGPTGPSGPAGAAGPTGPYGATFTSFFTANGSPTFNTPTVITLNAATDSVQSNELLNANKNGLYFQLAVPTIPSGDSLQAGIGSSTPATYYFIFDEYGYSTNDINGQISSAVPYSMYDKFSIYTDGQTQVVFMVNGVPVSNSVLDYTNPFYAYITAQATFNTPQTVIDIRFYPTGGSGTGGASGPTQTYGTFVSRTTQMVDPYVPASTPVAITYDAAINGSLTTVGATYPSSQIEFTQAGTYKVTMSAQCDNLDYSANHWISIWPAINGTSVADSRRTVYVPLAGAASGPPSLNEFVLTTDYIVTVSANDYLQFYMVGESGYVGIEFIAEDTGPTPVLPATPSIAVTIVKIA